MKDFIFGIARMVSFFVLMFVLAVSTLGCEEEESPEGTLWFCVVKYKSTGKPIAAWASKRKPYVSEGSREGRPILFKVIGYGNTGKVIFEDVDMHKDQQEKIVEYSVVAIEKIVRDFPKYVDSWKGTILPGCENIVPVNDESSRTIKILMEKIEAYESRINLISKNANGSGTVRIPEKINLGSLVQRNSQNEEITKINVSYTYSYRRMRGDDFKYNYHIMRSDGKDVWQCSTEMEVEKLIPLLK